MTAAIKVAESALDVELGKDKGMIERGPGRDCRHNARSKCSRCLPLDPYDPEYLAEKEIKHMSFHAYVRKLTGSLDWGRSSVLSYPLEVPVCRVKDCAAHPPYPAAICSKCQPDPVILARQAYRHVDNVAFENPEVVDSFLDYWRKSGGAQRIGILMGRYERHPDVPLGIRANVVAIFEPPQTSTRDSVTLDGLGPEDATPEWLAKLDGLGEGLDIRPLGWILTDLVQIDGGKFHHSRDAHRSFLVSAQECITAATLQNKFPNTCRWAEGGAFGSKFVTVIVSGDKEGSMEFRGWQMSNQAAALVRDAWLVPTAGTPDQAFVRSDAVCVPDVKYSEKDQYGNTVTRDARPFPVEYLLVDVPAGLSAAAARTFCPDTTKPRFLVENRGAGQEQTLAAFAKHVGAFGEGSELALLTDFHLLAFLWSNPACALPEDARQGLLDVVRKADAAAAAEWLKADPTWAQLTALGSHEAESAVVGGGASASGGAEWACAHCTFHNPPSASDCAICGLPHQRT